MNWEAIGAVGEIVGAVAVVATLAYLAVQVKQTNCATKTSSEQAVFTNFVGLTADLINDNETVGILRKGFASWEALTPDEQATIRNYWATLLGHLTMAYTLFREGTLNEETYLGFENNARSALLEPGLAEWWESASRNFNAPLVQQLQRRLAEGTDMLPPRFTEIYPYYRS